MAIDDDGRTEIAAILSLAAQHDGPIRVLRPRGGYPKGLFPSSKGKHGELIADLVGTMLEEVSRLPRTVRLTPLGIHRLIKNTPQAERANLVQSASPLYREAMLLAWESTITRGEQDDYDTTAAQLYGHWFPDAKAKDEMADYREYLAQEIADSWSQATTDETRNRLAHLLKLLGSKPLGQPNEKVPYTCQEHATTESIFPGEDVIITRPGWLFPKNPTPLLLAKAEVTPASA